MADKAETFDQLCTRLAYYIMQDIARGTSAERIASNIATQTLLWRSEQDKKEAHNDR